MTQEISEIESIIHFVTSKFGKCLLEEYYEIIDSKVNVNP